MQSNAKQVNAYLEELEGERKTGCKALRKTVLEHLPQGFHEEMSYGMVGYVVPHTVYPAGYHCDPEQPLPFISFASQKQHYSFYHMGLYADRSLHDWFVTEYEQRIPTKLNMGKSCIRIRKMTPEILELIGELVEKMSVDEWVALYEKAITR